MIMKTQGHESQRITNLRDKLIHVWNRGLDTFGRIDARAALNDGITSETKTSGEVAIELRALMNELKALAYDAEKNQFDYHAVRNSAQYIELQRCAARLVTFDPVVLTNDKERLAFWVNVYNVLMVHAVIAFGIQTTVWQDKGFFRRAAYRIHGWRVSADEIEHGILRRNRLPPYMPLPVFISNDTRRAWSPSTVDTRIHTALNCASRSCPPIAAYASAQLDAQLDLAARAFVNATTQLEMRADKSSILTLSPIFKWYAQDFGGREGILDFVARYWMNAQEAEQMRRAREMLRIKWARYDWSLNG